MESKQIVTDMADPRDFIIIIRKITFYTFIINKINNASVMRKSINLYTTTTTTTTAESAGLMQIRQ